MPQACRCQTCFAYTVLQLEDLGSGPTFETCSGKMPSMSSPTRAHTGVSNPGLYKCLPHPSHSVKGTHWTAAAPGIWRCLRFLHNAIPYNFISQGSQLLSNDRRSRTYTYPSERQLPCCNLVPFFSSLVSWSNIITVPQFLMLIRTLGLQT